MKKLTFAFIAVVLNFSFSQAADFPYIRPLGTYVYKGQLSVTKLVRTEVIDEANPNAKTRMSELKAQGFSCARRSPQSCLCRKNEVPNPKDVPQTLVDLIGQKLSSFYISFFGGGTPVLKLDTTTTQEWMLEEQVDVNKFILQKYGYTFYYDTNLKRIIFPVSDEQPVPYVQITDDNRLVLNFLVNAKQQNMNLGYVVDAYLQSK